MHALILLALLQDPPPATRDEIGARPLQFASLSPFQSVRSGLAPRSPSPLAAGEMEFHASGSWVNVWAFNEDDWILDYEVALATGTLSWCPADGWLLEAAFEQKLRFGGELDSIIDDFHDFVGAETRHREDFPQDEFRFDLDPKDGTPPISLHNEDRGSFSRSIALALQRTLFHGGDGWPAVDAAISVRVASDDVHGPNVDGAVSLSASKRLSPHFFLYLSLNAGWFGREEFHELELRRTQGFAQAAIEWRLMPRTSLVLQYLLSQGAVSGLKKFSEPAHEVTFGWKIEIAPGTIVEVGVVENLVVPDNSPDFGIHGGVTVRF